jgi:protein PhnA
MSLIKSLQDRSGNQCEICTATNNLSIYNVPPNGYGTVDDSVLICETCKTQLENLASIDSNHWRCLNESMWSEVDAVKVISWRMLNRLRNEGWSRDLLEMMYLEDDVKKWAEASGDGIADDDKIIHKDANGVILETGDTVALIKDLNVKGGGFTAKRGTAVRKIVLVHDNAEQIEGKVEGQQIVILTQYVKKM